MASRKRKTKPAVDDSLIEKFRRNAEELEKALDLADDPKQKASIATTLNRTYWHIGGLTGEAQMTESKIVKSEAWKNLLGRVEVILQKHPEAATELAAYFESLER